MNNEILKERGIALAQAGLKPSQLAFDLDETMWEWSAPVFRQPTILLEHREYIFLREPILALLDGIATDTKTPFCIWTAGYGYRLDRVAEKNPTFKRVFGVTEEGSESLAHIVTRRNLASALERQPSLIPHSGPGLAAEKIPGAPTAAGKPIVDAARVLIDDKEHNCQRFIDAGGGRSAIWLKQTVRRRENTLPGWQIMPPKPKRWADGIADALEEILGGKTGIFPVNPVPSQHSIEPIRISLPHSVFMRDWIQPSRTIKQCAENHSASAGSNC